MFRSSRSDPGLHLNRAVLLPPKLSELGHQPFTAIERESLARMMREPAWPRGTLNIYGLEGYLTALLVWPVALHTGAWLPPIWNEQSWRMRPPIDTEDRLCLISGAVCLITNRVLRCGLSFRTG